MPVAAHGSQDAADGVQPELQEDSAAVITTRFMTLPTQPRPIFSKTVANGLTPDSYSFQGSTMASRDTLPT